MSIKDIDIKRIGGIMIMYCLLMITKDNDIKKRISGIMIMYCLLTITKDNDIKNGLVVLWSLE